MTTTTMATVSIDKPWCSCTVRLLSTNPPKPDENVLVEIVEACWAHEAIGPAGFRPGEQRDALPGSLLARAVSAALLDAQP